MEFYKWEKRNGDITVKHVGDIWLTKGLAGKDTENIYARTVIEKEKRRTNHQHREWIGKNITYLKR